MRRHGWPLGFLIAALVLALAGTAFADDDDDDNDRPGVTSVAATEVIARSAILSAYVNPKGRSTTYFFEYGSTTAYGSSSAPASAGSSNSSQLVSTAIGALEPETPYHYRVVATNSKGTTRGSDRTFTTLADGEVPAAPGGQPSPTDPTGPPSGQPGDPAEGGTSVGPKLGSSVTLELGDGVVRVRRAGSSSFTALRAGSELPVGSEVDARNGSVALTSAMPSGGIQTGQFGGGRFLVRQGRSGVVDLQLRGRYCPKGRAVRSATSSAARKPRSSRRLWGRDNGGRFRTRGSNSHATVRGTRWLVVDRCDGTFTRVTSGSVVVRDTVRNKRIVLRAGQHYLAAPRR
jgi:hypothetical protein